ncbi:bifunctional metallophosphatase/5'-nucleotidase [Nocardioides sp.]|uniref:bifunctional metallophosphatase/5'-nucleotidase n=1 Tax=Nocardioides sp. TaxID=35761 RepID=UPI0025E90B2C|nr:bifunctional metallophosphatase/5'-nucleotidase [Nocardioides sp.]
MSLTTPRRVVAAATASAVALIGLAATASSTAPEYRSGADGQKAYASLAKSKKKDYVKLDVLAINDFHGQLEVVPPTSSSGRINNTPAGGGAFLASLLKQERKKSRAAGAKTVTVAAGDLIGASPLLSAAFHDEPTIEAMNMMGLDIASVGNHEFDEGWRELKRMQNGGCLADGTGANGQDSCPGGKTFEGAKFKYLGANVKWKDPNRKRSVFPATKIVKVKGQKVAFIGMTLEDTDTIVAQAGIAEIEFADEVATANALVPKLRKKGVKSIIVLLHEGVTPTDATAYNDCTVATGAALDIAKNLSPKIDAVVSGHTHQPYNCVVKDPAGKPRLLTSASSLGRIVTKLHFLIDPKTRDIVRPAAYAHNIIVGNSEGQAQSKKITSLISLYNTLVKPIADQVIGHLDGVSSITRTADVNGGDSALGNLIADAQKADPSIIRNGQKPVLAFMNPGGIRADLVENANGDVTYGAAFAVQPFSNNVVSMDLTGAQIKAVLNEQWNGTNEPSNQRKILQVSGLEYTWDASEAALPGANALVGDVMVDADGDPLTAMVPLVDGQTYRVAANVFISDGGDNFATFKSGTNKLVGGLDIDSLRLYLGANDPTAPTATDRIDQQA